MDARPKLTVTCNYYLGGVANYHRNILSQDTNNTFDKNILFLYWDGLAFTKLDKGFGLCPEKVYKVSDDIRQYSKDIAAMIDDEQGTVVTNFEPELAALFFYPKPKKTVVYICHDELYVPNVQKYDFLIDAYIAHNPYFYNLMRQQLPGREKDIYYLPYGVHISALEKKANMNRPLNLVFLARLNETKGIYELPVIDDLLIAKGVQVNWTIIGDGPEKEKFRELVKERKNFSHHSPPDNSTVMQLLDEQDLFILPSRLDGLPVAMLETMSRGIVPLMYEFNTGIKQIIKDDVGYVVATGDNEAIVEHICRLNADRLLLRQMSQQGRSKVVEEYDIKKQAKKYFDFYGSIKPSTDKAKWKTAFAIYGYEFHPLIPASLVRLYRRIRASLSRRVNNVAG